MGGCIGVLHLFNVLHTMTIHPTATTTRTTWPSLGNYNPNFHSLPNSCSGCAGSRSIQPHRVPNTSVPLPWPGIPTSTKTIPAAHCRAYEYIWLGTRLFASCIGEENYFPTTSWVMCVVQTRIKNKSLETSLPSLALLSIEIARMPCARIYPRLEYYSMHIVATPAICQRGRLELWSPRHATHYLSVL